MKYILTITGLLGVLLCPSAWSYDAELAKDYEKMFAPVTGEKAGKALRFVNPDGFVKDIKAGKEIVAIDVRTPAEMDVFTLSLPNSLKIPTNEIFQKENLDRLPTDKPMMIVCKSGARATAVGTALRSIGFDNVYILKGGFQGLSKYYGPKQAYEELE